MKTVNSTYSIITGASQGLGKSFAKELASQGRNVLLVSKRNENLEALSKGIHKRYGVQSKFYELDLTDFQQLDEFTGWVNKHFSIDLLINNAGMGGTVSFENCSTEYLNKLIQLNVRVIPLLTHKLLPNLKKNSNPSFILNVSSMAAFCPMAYKSIYPATKKFIQHFSEGLNHELNDYNIKVATVFPGPMMTNPDVSYRIEKQGFLAKLSLQSTEEVARSSLMKLYKGKSIIIVGILNKFNRMLMQIIPNGLLIPMVSNVLKKELGTKNLIHDIALQ